MTRAQTGSFRTGFQTTFLDTRFSHALQKKHEERCAILEHRVHGLGCKRSLALSIRKEAMSRNTVAEKNSNLFWHFAAPYIASIIVAALWVRFSELPSLFQHPTGLPLIIGCLAGISYGLVGVSLSRALEEVPWYRKMARWFKVVFRDVIGPRVHTRDALTIALYSSVGEEAFFRGALQPWIERSFTAWVTIPEVPTVLAIIVTSLIFGLLHAPIVKELRPWTLMAVIIGMGFGCLAAYSGCLLPAILAHFIINFLNLLRLNTLDVSLSSEVPK